MLLAIRRWRSERSCSAWPWKSSASVSRLSIAAFRSWSAWPDGPRRRDGIVWSAALRGGANSAAFPGLFAPLPARVAPYSASVLIALLAPLARVPRRLAWALAVALVALAAALPARGDEAVVPIA